MQRGTPHRVVRATVRDGNDDITALAGDWGVAPREEVITGIKTTQARYVILDGDGNEAEVVLRQGRTAEFLWAGWGSDNRNRLDDVARIV